jgi:hypothetical protein
MLTSHDRWILLFLVFAVLTGPSAVMAQFVEEEIVIRVGDGYCLLEGTYKFRNPEGQPALWPIFYPLLDTDAIPLADSIRVRDARTGGRSPLTR